MLRSGKCTEYHAKQLTARAQRIIEGCSFVLWRDIRPREVVRFLSTLRQDTDKRRGISVQTSNFYLQAIQQFCGWMVQEQQAAESPIRHLTPLNVKTDRRHDRRALTIEELRRLLHVTRHGPVVLGIAGYERAMLYRLAVETGLRAGELRSLTRASFRLVGGSPTVRVAAAYSKHRREDVLPLRKDTTAELVAFLASKSPEASAFRLPSKPAAMLRVDLKAAGIPYRDGAGRVVDFHALRHTFITNLARTEAHPKIAQELARHSTITLTMDRYTHTLRGQQVDALENLPDLSMSPPEDLAATGTDGAGVNARPHAEPFATASAKQGGSQRTQMDFSGRKGPSEIDSASAIKPSRLRCGPVTWHGHLAHEPNATKTSHWPLFSRARCPCHATTQPAR